MSQQPDTYTVNEIHFMPTSSNRLFVDKSDDAAIIAGKDAEIDQLRAEVERLTKAYAEQADACRARTQAIAQQAERIAELERDRKEDAGNLAKLLRSVKYFIGIAERGTGNSCPVDQSAESFVLEYVKGLEALIADQSAALAKAKEALEGVCDSDEECQDSDGWTAAAP